MGHHITALISKLPIDEDKAREYDLPVIRDTGFAIIGLHASHSDFWTERLGIVEFEDREMILDCASTHFFASALFGDRAYAIIETDYFGGLGEQAAAVYQEGSLLMATERSAIGPINKALHLLGMKRTSSRDEFTTLGLGMYRHFDSAFTKYSVDRDSS